MAFEYAWKNRHPSTYGNEKVNMIGLDDLVAAKKFASRHQDKIDVDVLLAAKKIHSKKSK